MTKLRALVYAGIAATTLTYAKCNYDKAYSSEEMFGRQKSLIENTSRRRAYSKRPPLDKKALLSELRSGLDKLDGKSIEEKCRFDSDFAYMVRTGDRTSKASTKEQYTPYSQCKPTERAKETKVFWPMLIGVLALIGSIISLIRSFSTDPGGKGPEGVKKQKEQEAERKSALVGLGASRKDAETIARESIKLQSMDDVMFTATSAPALLGVLERYGFSKSEILSIAKAHPAVLNRSPTQLTEALMGMEGGNPSAHDAVKAQVLRFPYTLG